MELKVIFSGSPMDAGVVKEILEDNGIKANLRNELMGTIAPWHVSAGGMDPVEVEVLGKDEEKALALVQEFKNS